MASLLDQLLNEIAVITGLSVEEVSENFTQEQLDHLLEVSKCEDESSITPIATNLEDISCSDSGAPADSIDQTPIEVKDDRKDDVFDGTECLDSVQEVNAEIKKQLDRNTEYNILLNRLYELRDNIIPLKYYYAERANRLAVITGEFKPILAEMKRLRDEIDYNRSTLIPNQQARINFQKSLEAPNYEIIKAANAEIERLQGIIDADQKSFKEQDDLRNNIEAKYPLMTNNVINSYANFTNASTSQRTALVTEIKQTISNSTIQEVNRGLERYSEYISMSIKTPVGTFTNIVSNPLIGFDIKFQELFVMKLDKEKFDLDTGDRSIYQENFLIKESQLLLKNSFFEDGPGYEISHISANNNFSSRGAIYEQYYNLLEDPVNNFFTIEERGLTDDIQQLDPKLEGQDAITKRELGKEYFIHDIDRLQYFYKEFDANFKARSKQIRASVLEEQGAASKPQLELIAKYDVELLLALGRINLFNQPGTAQVTNLDGSTSTVGTGMYNGAQTVIDSVNNANLIFVQRIADLDEEIKRIETIIEDSVSSDKIKASLKLKNEKCFGSIPDDNPCEDTKSLMGSDPFFQSIGGIDPTLPNFSQMCYWKEFSKLATMQGLFPISNDPKTFRYWPVGLVIPTPAKLIKIPLPQVWVPLVTISTPLGVLVIFLNINGVFISPVVFFLSATGYKQHLVTVRGSSEKFGSDADDELIKPTIQIPLSIQSKIDLSKVGSLNPDKLLSSDAVAKIGILTDKLNDAKNAGDLVRVSKAIKEIKNIKKQAVDEVKPETAKMSEIADKVDNITDMVDNIKKKVFKIMDDLGKPPTDRINKLKERLYKRINDLKTEKVKALESRKTNKVKEINEKLKTDGLNLKVKVNAYVDDLLDYFDRITFPTVVLPKEPDKLDPKPDSVDATKDAATEMSTSNDKEFVSDKVATVKNIISVAIAKYKTEIEAVIPPGNINIDVNSDKIKEHMKTALHTVSEKARGKGSNPVDAGNATAKLKEAKDKVDRAKNKIEKSKAIEKLNDAQQSLSKAMDSDRVKQTLSMTPAIISALSGVNISIDPFAPCCASDSFSIEFPFPSAVGIVIDQGVKLIETAISNMSVDNLKAMFGGKTNISPRDMRLGLLNITKMTVPNSLSIPKPELNLKAGTDMFSGLLGALSIKQANFPSILGAQQLKKQTSINLSIVKPIIRKALEEYLQSNLLNKNSQSLDTDFIYSNPSDIKAFMKKFIDSMSEKLENVLKPIYAIINAPNIKTAKGLNLNVLESAVFKVPPYGKVAESLFIAKGQLKFSIPKSKSQFVINKHAADLASGIMKASLTPIVNNPIAGLLVAGAGVGNVLDSIRQIHPILSADDIPPWERLTLKNILFLVFLDEFNKVGADQVGFFRSYL